MKYSEPLKTSFKAHLHWGQNLAKLVCNYHAYWGLGDKLWQCQQWWHNGSEIKGSNLGTVENCCEKKRYVTRFIDEGIIIKKLEKYKRISKTKNELLKSFVQD